jgi:ATP-dependent Lon protease
MDSRVDEKLRQCFDEMVVFKDLRKSNFFSALSLPSFMRDWLLKKFMKENGEFSQEEMAEFIRKNLPRKEDWNGIKSRLITELERIKFLAKVSIDIDVKTGVVSFALPDFSLPNKETMIPPDVWYKCASALVKGHETWGVVELQYLLPDEELKTKGLLQLVGFDDFCPYTIDLDYYKDARKEFTVQEWIDILLGAVDYNAEGYADEEQKLTMLTRLLPFVEKRLNMIELAPKGTGKSYLYGRVSRFGWLSSGGVMSRAKLFYDMQRRQEGLVAGHDFVVFDEVQTISFTDVDEMRAALKGYMESGVFTVGKYEGKADSGIILCGNISQDKFDVYQNMFEELPEVFHESALIDRFHGIIEGWHIPRMNDDLKISGWALNSEYFCSILHELRSDAVYRAIVDALVVVPSAADTRDTEAVKRMTTAYLKLLFPNVRTPNDITANDFNRYCLRPASKMRSNIKIQLGILDEEYKGKSIPKFTVNEEIYN